jgi:hypothetical protein
MAGLIRYRGRSALAVAGLLSFPLFFASLMASSLALEKPVVIAWKHHGKLVVHYKDASNATELRIWLAALVPPLIVLLIGAAATWLPRGIYIAAGGGIVVSLLLTIRLDRWTLHHSLRFPLGIDNLPESNTSNLVGRGEWEAQARSAVISLQHWTIGLAVAVIVVGILAEVRRRRGAPPPPPPPPAIAGDTQSVRAGLATGPPPFP